MFAKFLKFEVLISLFFYKQFLQFFFTQLSKGFYILYMIFNIFVFKIENINIFFYFTEKSNPKRL